MEISFESIKKKAKKKYQKTKKKYRIRKALKKGYRKVKKEIYSLVDMEF